MLDGWCGFSLIFIAADWACMIPHPACGTLDHGADVAIATDSSDPGAPSSRVENAAAAAEAGRPNTLDEEIRVQQTISLNRLMPAMIVGNLGVPLIVLASLLQETPLWFMAVWYGAVAVLVIPVVRNWWRFRHAPPPRRVSSRRIRSITIWSLAMGCVLAAGALYLLAHTGSAGQIPVYMLVLGLWAGALGSIWMFPQACIAYAAPMGLAIMIAANTYGMAGRLQTSIAIVLFIMIMAVFLRMNWHGFRKSVEAMVERDRLLASQTAEIERRRAAEQRLEQSLHDLHQAQDQLVLQEKMASLGALTAGIAHEIKNPLNFINNFSDVSRELLEELDEIVEPALPHLQEEARADYADLKDTLADNLAKITRHGQRADGIVKGMLMHSRGGASERVETDINALVDEAMSLAYHGARAQDSSFNIALERDFDPAAGDALVAPQEITRVLVNLCNNGFYAATARAKTEAPGFRPTLTASTRRSGDQIEIRVRDNGTGMSANVKEKLFTPFFTTKPTGEGTGLGLSLSYDIVVQQHKGAMTVESREGEYTEFKVVLPVRPAGQAGEENRTAAPISRKEPGRAAS